MAFGLEILSSDGTILAENIPKQYLIDRSDEFTIRGDRDGWEGRIYYPPGNGNPVYLAINKITGLTTSVSHAGHVVPCPVQYPRIVPPNTRDKNFVYWELPLQRFVRDGDGKSASYVDGLIYPSNDSTGRAIVNKIIDAWDSCTYHCQLLVTVFG